MTGERKEALRGWRRRTREALRAPVLRLRPVPDVDPGWFGGRVLLVGNARTLRPPAFEPAALEAPGLKAPGLETSGLGDFDTVVRFNRAPSLAPLPGRTDVLATGIPLSRAEERRIRPGAVAWLAPSVAKLPLRWLLGPRPPLGLFGDEARGRLCAAIGVAVPSSGAMGVWLALRAAERTGHAPHVVGFDGFRSGTLSGRRKAAWGPHDFERERAWMEGLARDGRIVWHRASDGASDPSQM